MIDYDMTGQRMAEEAVYNRVRYELDEFIEALNLDSDAEGELLTLISDLVTAAMAVATA